VGTVTGKEDGHGATEVIGHSDLDALLTWFWDWVSYDMFHEALNKL
jgi:hypothetical protein